MSFPFLQPYAGLSNSLQTAQAGGAGGVGGWVELARTTLGIAGDTIDVTSLPDKRYYMVLSDIFATDVSIDYTLRFNGDSGSNYAYRKSEDGGSDGTSTSTVFMLPGDSNNANGMFSVGYASNLSSKEKLFLSHTVHGLSSGAGTAPKRVEHVGKHVQTSNPISSMTMENFGTSSYDTNSELVVLGWDPADTHTSNFWEELASVETSATGELSSGTFTAKKYLWVQAYTPSSTNSSPDGHVEFNADSGTNYASRRSHNGGSDTTATNDGIGIRIDGTGGQTAKFHNLFIINNSSNEKLVIAHSITANTAGAGIAPSRTESVGKWVNTSNQITRVDIIDQYASSQWGAGSIIKVWGAN